MESMKIANKKLIEEKLKEGCLLEFSLVSKVYLTDTKHTRLFSIRFDTYSKIKKYINLVEAEAGRFSSLSNFYKIA